MQELQKIAVVIDADNTQISKLEDVFHEISTRGRIVVKRAFGNWHKPTLKTGVKSLSGWRLKLSSNSTMFRARTQQTWHW